MAYCDTCGNEWSPIMRVQIGERQMQFDCFECAITALAPRCSNCGCIVVGHGVTPQGHSAHETCCSEHCARERMLRDHNGRSASGQLDQSLAASFPASDPSAASMPH